MKHRRLLSVVAALALGWSVMPAGAQLFSKDARFTILLLTFSGPGHVKKSKEARDYLKANVRGIKPDFYLIHEEDRSVIYYGGYKAVDASVDANDARRAKEDLRTLIGLRVGDSTPFVGAIFVSAPTPDPVAPPEWDIRNAKGVWSLQIASYKTFPAEQKQAAVDTVREARKAGIEAYFHHGPNVSSVLVGAFPEEAIEVTQVDARTLGAKAPPGRELLVMPFMPRNLPNAVPQEDGSIEVTQEDGTITRIYAPRTVVRDPVLMKLIRDYPELAVNGVVESKVYRDPTSGKEVRIPTESLIIDLRKIRTDSMLSDGGPGGRTDSVPASPDAVAPRPSTPGSGKLKQIK